MDSVSRPLCAAYVIIRKDDKIAFVLRANTNWMNDHYGLPSGKVETGESFGQAAIREAKEEIGIDIAGDDLKEILTMHRYEGEVEYHTWVDVFFEPVKWSGEPFNAEPHMHSELAWLDPHNLPDNLIPSIRVAIDCITKGISYVEYGW